MECAVQRVLKGLKLIDQFGCARTNNSVSSTRYLRTVKVAFGANSGTASGVQVTAEALEKSRLTEHPLNESNFPVLYQLCQGVTEKQREMLALRPR